LKVGTLHVEGCKVIRLKVIRLKVIRLKVVRLRKVGTLGGERCAVKVAGCRLQVGVLGSEG
jgi:hypothetical protein